MVIVYFGATLVPFFAPAFDLVEAFDCFTRFLPGFRNALPVMSLGDKPILAIMADSFLILAARCLLTFPASRASAVFKADCRLLIALLS